MTTLPTIDQLLAIEPTTDRVVPPEFIDENGHMNIRHYFDAAGLALWEFAQHRIGLSAEYIRDRNLTTYTAEHHLRYFAELREGERFSVHVRLVDASHQVVHLVALVVDRSNQRLACVMETVLVHVDLATRRPAPFPDDVAALIDDELTADRALGWQAPLSGAMGVRRS